MAIIQDSSTGVTAKVHKDNLLAVRAIVFPESAHATDLGNSYNINSGLITLTNDAESGVLYFKNNDNMNIHIDAIVAILGPSTNGITTDTTRVRVYGNPTTGTLISNEVDADVVKNRNLGDPSALDALIYKGATGNTITNGGVVIDSLINPGGRVSFNIDLNVPKGKSVAITFEPNDSNTSMKCMAALVLHIESDV